MTKKQFESKINKLASDGELISMLNNIYDSNATFRDIMNSVLDDSDADKVFGKYKKRLLPT